MNSLVKNLALACCLLLLVTATSVPAGADRGRCADPQACAGSQIPRPITTAPDYDRHHRVIESEDRPPIFTEQPEQNRRDLEDRKTTKGQFSDDQLRRKRRIYEDVDTAEPSVIDKESIKRRKHARSDWQFDPRKHKRRHKKDKRFRYRLAGYWYLEPYWLYGYGYALNDSISCSEGRDLLRELGYSRVRILECQGRLYTYLARRGGKTSKVVVDSRSGYVIRTGPV